MNSERTLATFQVTEEALLKLLTRPNTCSDICLFVLYYVVFASHYALGVLTKDYIDMHLNFGL